MANRITPEQFFPQNLGPIQSSEPRLIIQESEGPSTGQLIIFGIIIVTIAVAGLAAIVKK